MGLEHWVTVVLKTRAEHTDDSCHTVVAHLLHKNDFVGAAANGVGVGPAQKMWAQCPSRTGAGATLA